MIRPSTIALPAESAHVPRAAWISWAILITIGLVIVGAIVGAPLAEAYGHPAIAAPIYKVFSFVCHQIPDRSFHLAAHQFGVCSRCTGIYSGFAIAALIYPLTSSLAHPPTPSRWWLMLAAGPMAIDFALGYFNIWENNHLSRFSTGALLGSIAVFFIMPGLIELFDSTAQWLGRRRQLRPSN